MNKYITLITFIPWIFVYIIFMINNLNNKDYDKISLKYIKKNIFKIFRLDILILLIAFFYFASYNKLFIDKYLFAVMCIYMGINSFYEKKEKIKKVIFKEKYINIIVSLIIMLLPLIFYYIKGNVEITYKIMFLYLFFQYILTIIINYISHIIKKVIKKYEFAKANSFLNF